MLLPTGIKLAIGGVLAGIAGWYLWGKLFPAAGTLTSSPPQVLPQGNSNRAATINVAWNSPPASARVPSVPVSRHLTAWEQAVLQNYFRPDFLASVILHIGQWSQRRPPEPGVAAVTDSAGEVWVQNPNIVFTDPTNMSMLAHEIMHVAQTRTGMTDAQYAQAVDASRGDPMSNPFEAEAYNLGSQVWIDLTGNPNGAVIPLFYG